MDAVKGLVYLILALSAVGGVVIAIMGWKLKKQAAEIGRLIAENGKLKRELADMKDVDRVEALDDEELADDARAALRDF